MKFGTETAATHAGQKLDSFLERVEKDTAEVLAQGDIPTTVKHFAEFRATERRPGRIGWGCAQTATTP